MFKCELCNNEFLNKKSLSIHITKIHKNVEEYYIKYLCNQIPVCKTCKKKTKFKGLSIGFSEFCSRKCMNKNIEIQNKKKETLLKKYNIDNPMKSKDIKDKQKETLLKNYGVDNPMKSNINIQKIKNNWKNKNEDEIKDIVKKREDTTLKKYNKKNISQVFEVQLKKEKTSLKNWNVKNVLQSSIIKEKIKNTCIDKYNEIHSSKSLLVKEKIKETINLKYKKDYIFQVNEIKEKIKNSHLRIRNVDNPFKHPIVKKKYKDTCLDKYNETHPSKNKDIKNKRKENIRNKYNVDNIFQIKEIKDNIKRKRHDSFILKFLKFQEYLKIFLIDEVYINSSEYHNWRCSKCNHIFKTCWNNIQQGYLCPSCYPRNNGISKGEKELLDYICNFIEPNDIIQSDRIKINPYELDIYIPKLKVAIEFNGLYWHSEQTNRKDIINYHLNKTNLCEEQGIQLIHIFEDEWILKKNIVKSRLQNILNISRGIKIHGRKCIIKEIDSKIKNNFLEENHIQGKDSSSIKLGAFYKNELVSVMTFSKGNISKGSKPKDNVWELNRFCSKLNYHIPGIASKLLSYFKKNYIWIEIFSYADRRWSMGKVYNKLGFELNHITGPNYWYVKGMVRIHRFNLRKRKDEPKDIPEKILRIQEGYSRIWDCGNYKYQITNFQNNTSP